MKSLWKIMARLALITWIVSPIFFQPPAIAQDQSNPGKNIHLQWTFGAIKNRASGSRIETITRDTVLQTGDRIKFFIYLQKPCFAYLIYYSSQGELSVLFPYRFKTAERQTFTIGRYYIPGGDQWFELDQHGGAEKFYLLASTRKLALLEALVNNYESADRSQKPELAKQVLAEIRRLRKKHLKFKTAAERPVSVVGNMRGTEKKPGANVRDLAEFAMQVSAGGFYSRTFTIDHR